MYLASWQIHPSTLQHGGQSTPAGPFIPGHVWTCRQSRDLVGGAWLWLLLLSVWLLQLRQSLLQYSLLQYCQWWCLCQVMLDRSMIGTTQLHSHSYSFPTTFTHLNLYWTKWTLAFVCFSFFFSHIFSLATCARLSGILSFWVHFKLFYRIVSYRRSRRRLSVDVCLPLSSSAWFLCLLIDIY